MVSFIVSAFSCLFSCSIPCRRTAKEFREVHVSGYDCGAFDAKKVRGVAALNTMTISIFI